LGEDNLAAFFKRLGFDQPPLKRVGVGEAAHGPPSCPLGLTPRGFTQRGRYIDAVVKTYDLIAQAVEKAEEAAERLTSLGLEVNKDIDKFHLNYDLLSIISFIKSMDQDLLLRKKILGSNFGSEELSSLEKRMTFKKVDPTADGVRRWPQLPPAAKARRAVEDLLGRIFHQDKDRLIKALKNQ
jgi:hypothetical protein